MAFTLVTLLTGAVFLLAGGIQSKFPPKKINPLYGYRTRRAMQSEECWHFAQKYSAQQMIKLGAILALLGSIGMYFSLPEIPGVLLALAVLVTLVIGMLIHIENRLKDLFGND